MNGSDDNTRLVYLAGSLFSRAQELRALLQEWEASGQHQGELHLTHRASDGGTTRLLIHIDGPEFTMMLDDADTGFRLDVSDGSLHIE